MNFLVKFKNNFEYAYYRNVGYACALKMKEHAHDKDTTEWNKWAALCLKYLTKCITVPLQ